MDVQLWSIDFEGKVGGILVVCRDVTSERVAREALNLMNEELKHRVKNTLTVWAPWPLRHSATLRAEPISKNIRRLAGWTAPIYLPQQSGLSAPARCDQRCLTPYRTGEG